MRYMKEAGRFAGVVSWERKTVEYGWEGLFLGRMLDSSPMPADARSAQYDRGQCVGGSHD